MIINAIPTELTTTSALTEVSLGEEGDFAAQMSDLLAKLTPAAPEGEDSSQPQTDEDLDEEIHAINLPAAITADVLIGKGDVPRLAANIPASGTAASRGVLHSLAEIQRVVNAPVAHAQLVSHELSHTASQIQEAKTAIVQEQDNRFALMVDKPRNETPQEPALLPGNTSESAKPLVPQTVAGEPNALVNNNPTTVTEHTPFFASTNPDATLVKPAVVPAAVVSLPQPTGTTEWQQSLGQQLACFTRDGIHHAELRLHPEELGAVQISLRMSNERMQIHFVADNPQARNALENALPYLRNSLAESGINLGQSSVSADSNSSSNSFFEKDRAGSGRLDLENGEEASDDPVEQHIISHPMQYSSGINTFV